MQVISIVQQKGGVGKTTLAINVAGALKQRGLSVMVVDADPQGSATAWAFPRKLGFEVKAELLANGTLSIWLRNILKQRADVILIDTPAGLSSVFRAAVDVADLVLIPCGPSSLDINAARTTLLNVVSALRSDARSRTQIAIVPTRVDVRTPEGQQITDELSALGENVSPPLSHDVYFVRAFTQGVSVTAAAPASNAAQEIKVLTDFLLESLAASGA
ncbi:ParA family protein [Methylobacterium sp. J-026]|uniref:ParA family protein n=1 Tax=Methylobacterium sp. J-026 TaxID=2836624 RepID=UPI00244479D4|nr:ParA family protein [Methylobacterium sp. J-026]